MPHAVVRLAPALVGAVLVMAACSPACTTSTAASQTDTLTRSSTEPDGFLLMEVMGVLPTNEGHAVFLVSEIEQVILPIWIGGSEALAIQLRLERRRFERPLTHDLLDELVRELGGHVTKVQVDDLRGATFVGTVYVDSDGHQLRIDARPSDAIALAVGNHVPIFVSRQVVERAGLTTEDLDATVPSMPPGDPDFEESPRQASPELPERPPLELGEPLDPNDMVLRQLERLEL